MTISRVTQGMLTQRSVGGLQAGLSRLAAVQEQLSTGKTVNRPSDSPTETSTLMRLRAEIGDQQQYVRNADNGLGWLNTADSVLGTMDTVVSRVRELALQGANTGAQSATARAALAQEVDQLRQTVLQQANTTYLGRPVFGGTTAGPAAFDTITGAYAGDAGSVTRTVAPGTTVRIDVSGTDVLGPDGNSLLDDLSTLSTALRTGDETAIRSGLDALDDHQERIRTTQSTVGGLVQRLELASTKAKDSVDALKASLSEMENTDLPKAAMELQLQEVAYQAALAATSRVLQPSLVDFLR